MRGRLRIHNDNAALWKEHAKRLVEKIPNVLQTMRDVEQHDIAEAFATTQR
jgi:hypothetical protein